MNTFSIYICDRVCIKGPLVGRYETEISAVKVNWSVLVGFREISQSGSILHKEAIDSNFKLISKLESSRNQYFCEQIKGDLNLESNASRTVYHNIIKQIMKCLFNEIHLLSSGIFFWTWKNIILNLHVVSCFKRVHLSEFQSL